ncbi:SpoIIE family protein phosphatase [Streptomyces sp. NPDC001414]
MPSGEVLALVDGSGRVVEWRRRAEEHFGVSADEAIGQSVSALLRSGLVEIVTVQVTPVLRGTSVLWQVLAADGARDVPQGQDVALLETLFTRSPASLYVLDAQLRVARVNITAGGPLETVAEARRHFTEMCSFDDPEAEIEVARSVLRTGQPVMHRLVPAAPAPDGWNGRRIHAVTYFRLESSHEDEGALVACVADATEQEKTQRRLALLEEVRSRVGLRRHVMDVCRELAAAVVPTFASAVIVEVVEEVVRGEEPPAVPLVADVLLRRVAFGGPLPPFPIGDMRALSEAAPLSPTLSDLTPCLVTLEEGAPWSTADPAWDEAVRRSGARSLILAPLFLHEQALGLVSLYRHESEDPFDETDVATASEICAHAALRIDHARLYMREWIIAATVQRRLLPHQPAPHGTVEAVPLYPSGPEGAGAWFDAIALPGARTALIVGNVTGQGIAAAMTVGLLRTALHTLIAMDLPPDELLARLSDTAARLATARAALPPLDPMNRDPITTGCIIAVYDPVDLTCTIARAGLPQPVALFPDGISAVLSVPPGPLLGSPDSAPFPTATVHVPDGTTLVMGTNALAEQVLAPSGPLLPFLKDVGTTPLPQVRDAIASTLTGRHQADEALMLLTRTKALPTDRVLTRSLPADPQAAPIARSATRRQLREWGIEEETAFTTELLVSEFVGNAIRYGAPPLRLRLILDQKLTCEVSDTAPSAPHIQHARTIDETGRGLFIIASLADQWGIRYQSHGKTVWAEQPARG